MEEITLYFLAHPDWKEEQKIVFTLSYMTKGTAAEWRKTFLHEAETTTGINLGTWDAFKTKLNDQFIEKERPDFAFQELKNMKKKSNDSGEDYVNQFKNKLAQTSYKPNLTTPDDTNKMITDIFRGSLDLKTLEKIWDKSAKPNDLQAWYNATIEVSNQARMFKLFPMGVKTYTSSSSS